VKGKAVVAATQKTVPILEIERRLGHQFKSRQLFVMAMTHRSHSVEHNERLEFLGDGLLNCCVAELLFDEMPAASEGDLSRIRAHLVNQATLAELAHYLGIKDYLRLGLGELRSGGMQRASILADTCEALLAAIYLDAGFLVVRQVIRQLFLPLIQEGQWQSSAFAKDAKTRLQELLQKNVLPLPCYTIEQSTDLSGSMYFLIRCTVQWKTKKKSAIQLEAVGEGGNRKEAEQSAANQLLAKIDALKLRE
jgi:ribonuclease-3